MASVTKATRPVAHWNPRASYIWMPKSGKAASQVSNVAWSMTLHGVRILTQRTCERAPNQSVGSQGARCVPRVCVDLDRRELVSAPHLPLPPSASAPAPEPRAALMFVLHGIGLHSPEK
jgi:hypothetical protein